LQYPPIPHFINQKTTKNFEMVQTVKLGGSAKDIVIGKVAVRFLTIASVS
jgi:hypothetical protein